MAESGKLIFLNRAVNALAIAQEEKGVMKGVDGEFRNFDLKLLPFHKKIHSKLAFFKGVYSLCLSFPNTITSSKFNRLEIK